MKNDTEADSDDSKDTEKQKNLTHERVIPEDRYVASQASFPA
jgi:hypothetical protein